MPTRQQIRALSKTLDQAYLGYIKAEKIKWLAFADPDVKQNDMVHRATNDLLFKLLLDGNTGRCIHVTGEMRALLDPFHRDICVQMYRQSGKAFSVLYDLPKDRREDRNATIGWSLQRWSKKGTRKWEEYLRTFDAMAERAVDVHASNTENEIQYSVFGHRYILLQEKHSDAAKAKRVWLLEYGTLNEALTERGERLLDESTNIDERWYHSFMSSLGGMGARSVLRKLADGRALSAEELDNRKLWEFDAPALESAEALKIMGFTQTDDTGRWTISHRGKEYLDLLMQP